MKLRIQPGRAIRCAAMSAVLCASVSSYALAAGAKSEGMSGGNCANLMALDLPNAKVTEAQAVTSGTYQAEGARNPITKLPPFCRVHVVVKPAINVEVWMPLTGWNGKLMGLTGGGVLGSISYGNTVDLNEIPDPGGISGLANGIQRGYAMMATDGGHKTSENNWWNDLGRFIDLGYRGAHEMTVKGKVVTAAFYAQAPAKTYFDGCSGGGRVGMMEAQRFPEDYDGIIAGEPGANWTDLMVAELWATRASTDSPENFLPGNKMPMVTAAAVAKCDPEDGIKDGIISNPMACHFDPVVLQCKGADAPDCLTSGQVDALRKIYAGAKYPDGRRISFGHTPGSESGFGRMYTGVKDVNTEGGNSNRDFIKLSVFNDPNYDLSKFDYNHDMDYLKERTAAIMDATNPDMSGFKARGGKLLVYYGWADYLAPSGYTPSYYDSVVAKMGGQPAVADFYRLFMVPGMGHCRGGVGANRFDSVKVLESWVEKGQAPDQIIASRVDEKTKKVTMTRPLCPYPQVAHYTGSGSTDEAKNFYCAGPK